MYQTLGLGTKKFLNLYCIYNVASNWQSFLSLLFSNFGNFPILKNGNENMGGLNIYISIIPIIKHIICLFNRVMRICKAMVNDLFLKVRPIPKVMSYKKHKI